MSRRPKAAPEAQTRRVALRYITRFRCLAADCEDPCCSDWTITVDQGHYDKIHRALTLDPEGPGPQVLTPLPLTERSGPIFAKLRLQPDGSCSLLGADRLCHLQRAHGEAMLPNGCAMYPRSLKRHGSTLELTGELSCPEVSRLALLHDDATALVPVEEEQLGRGSQVQDSRPLGPAAAHLDLLRHTQLRILEVGEAEGLPLASRLFCGTFFAGNATRVLAAGGADVAARLAEAASRGTEPAMVQALHQRFEAGRGEVKGALPLVVGLLGTRVHHRSGPFHRFTGAVWESYLAEPGAGVKEALRTEDRLQVELDLPLLEQAYARRKALVEGRFAASLTRAFGNFARHYWIKEWYTDAPTVLTHSHALLLRLAILRFLLLSHPGAAAAAASADEAALGRLLVEASYSFARVMDHNTLFAASVRQTLRQLVNLGDAVALLQV